MLASYGQFWALAPALAGAALALVLLRGMERFVRGVFTPERAAGPKNSGGRGSRRALLLFALVKYPLVALLIWAAVRFWDGAQVMALAGGFVLIHAVIGLRAMGRYLVDCINENPPAAGLPGAGRRG
jgi:hypothetical protein